METFTESPTVAGPALAAPSARTLFRDGVRDIAPFTLGYVPMGLAIGAAIAESGVHRLAGWSGGPLIAAGTAHLTLVELVAAGGGVLAAVGAALAINARLIAYSAGMAKWFASEHGRRRAVVAFFTIDVTYLLATQRFEADDPGPADRQWYVLGLGLPLYVAWSAAMAVGVVVGSTLPPGLLLDRAALLMMVGLVAVAVPSRGHQLAATAGVVAGLTSFVLPVSVVPLVAAVAAVAISRQPGLWRTVEEET